MKRFFPEEIAINNTLFKKLFDRTHNVNLVFILFLRYKSLNSNNQQLAVYESFYRDLQEHLRLNFELFGSAINTIFPNYCSLFYDIEKYFGSKGSFFDYPLKEGFYVANPPYDENIMFKMTNHILDTLSIATSAALSILLVIPCWDRNESKYGKFHSIEKLQKSPHTVFIKKIFKKNTKFFNYDTNQLVSPVDVYFILVSNKSDIKFTKTLLYLIKKHFMKVI